MVAQAKRTPPGGFTLVELLVVVTLLAILAAVVVRPLGSTTEQAKVATLRSDLSKLRAAIERYYHEHNSTWPGAVSPKDGQTPPASAEEAAAAFVAQLTHYTDKSGRARSMRDATFRFGPYLKTKNLPPNPFAVDESKSRDVNVDIKTDDVTAIAADSGPRDNTGWKFYAITGRFIANDGQTLSDGTPTEDL